MNIVRPNNPYSLGRESTHTNISIVGIDSRKQACLLLALSTVSSTCLGLGDKDYKHALKVWKDFGIRKLGEYHNLYL